MSVKYPIKEQINSVDAGASQKRCLLVVSKLKRILQPIYRAIAQICEEKAADVPALVQAIQQELTNGIRAGLKTFSSITIQLSCLIGVKKEELSLAKAMDTRMFFWPGKELPNSFRALCFEKVD